MIRFLTLLIGFTAFGTSVYAQEDPETLYMRIKQQVEQEMHTEEAELVVQRLAVGLFHDQKLTTIREGDGGPDLTVPFLIEDEEWSDFSIRSEFEKMCGSEELKTDYPKCLQAQDTIRRIIARNAWVRKLGRDLQLIASGYESGIDGYPGRMIDIIPRFASITHLWRAANDPFIHPIVEVLNKARPYPEGKKKEIQDKGQEVVNMLRALMRTWEEKKDDSEVVAAMWRYRHGVQYVIDREGECPDPEYFVPTDMTKLWMEMRWCDIEEKLIEIRDIVAQDPVKPGNEEHIIYPSIVRKKDNIFIWIRQDDVGLQQNIPFEPLQAALYHPHYGDCLDGDTPANCYDVYGEHMLIRGGEYPKKIEPEQTSQNPRVDPEAQEDEGATVPEPKEKEGLCSHPFSKRGYLCRRIEYEACDLTKKQKETLEDEDKEGIVLTQCQPERFKDDVARKSAGPNICGIGGWRDEVQDNLVEDTPEQQLDMVVNKCAACAIDVVCNPQEPCSELDDQTATASAYKRHGVIEVCMPDLEDKNSYLYLMAHEVTHAMQMCNESTLETLERAGIHGVENEEEGVKACCALEREAYFVQCKMYAIDGILDKAGVTIDQCASAFANHSCQGYDDDPDDDEYVCTNDGIDPRDVAKEITNARNEMSDILNLPQSCAEAMEHPRIKAMYNSIPLVCRPGCETKYDNTIGNNLCYIGQCIEEMHEWAKPVPGRWAFTTVDQDNNWDSHLHEDPRLAQFEVPPAITAPKFPKYRPEFMVQELDHALCQINGLPARTPPIICAYDELKRLGLPPASYGQSVDDLILQPEQFEATGLGLQYSAAGIGARVTSDMFSQYLRAAARQYTDLLNMTYHITNSISDVEFPEKMCKRHFES